MRATILALAFLALVPQADAQRAGGRGGGDRQQMMEKLRKAYDLDGDGQLGPDERRLAFDHLRKFRNGEPISDPRPTRLPAPDKLYKATAGPHTVAASIDLTLAPKGMRTRELPVRVTYPAGDGPWPVLVFSHGARGSGKYGAPMARHWASHGYAVLRPTHADSHEYGNQGGKASFGNWAQRPGEVSSLFDDLALIERRIPALEGKLDRTRWGVGGHSFGAGTAMLIGGVRPVARAQTMTSVDGPLDDGRVRCVVLVSPQGVGDILGADSYDGLARPAMTITGTKDDSGRTGRPWTWRLQPFEKAPAGGKYCVVIDGAHHNFGGINGIPPLLGSSGPLDGDHVRIVLSASTAMFDAYVKRDAAAKRYLAGEDLVTATRLVKLTRKLGAATRTGQDTPKDEDTSKPDDQRDALEEALGR